MDSREAFKFGFISRCIEEGITEPAELQQCIKQAEGILGPVKEVYGMGKDLVGDAAGWLLPVAAAGPAIAGAVGGTLLGNAVDVGDSRVDEIKREEILEEYRRQSDRLKRETNLRRLQAQRLHSGRVDL